ncbi:fasciclin domain-containing protein [Spongiivirga sp. MCCC 1A20706]|uniref:fasciclin domain-containing protein n=1 Tax=Spongiivirga sp. MCCC 1A20706 TaxID=3160963 RepID=UPI003977C4A0
MPKFYKLTAVVAFISLVSLGCEVQTLNPELQEALENIQNGDNDDEQSDNDSDANGDSSDGGESNDGENDNSSSGDGNNDGSGGNDNNATQNIIEYLDADANYSTFRSAIDRIGFSNALNNSSGNFTLFLPDNDAFDRYFETLGANIGLDNIPATLLSAMVNYHLKSGATASDNFTNGYISTLAKELSNNQDIDLYVQTGNSILLNGTVTIAEANINVTNGIIHKTSEVLKLPTVADFIDADPNMSSFKSIITEDVRTVLGDLDTDFTIFAPTNNAINNTDLTVFTSTQLVSLLNYHAIIASGSDKILISARLMDGMTITTIETGELTVSRMGDTIHITDEKTNTFSLSTLDIQAWNGAIHLIEGVLMPNSI